MVRKFIFFKTRDEILRVRPNQIFYFMGEGNYTTIVLINGNSFTFSTNIGQIENSLKNQHPSFDKIFYRVGKKYIVNLNYILHINQSKQKLTLATFVMSESVELSCAHESLKLLRDKLLMQIPTEVN